MFVCIYLLIYFWDRVGLAIWLGWPWIYYLPSVFSVLGSQVWADILGVSLYSLWIIPCTILTSGKFPQSINMFVYKMKQLFAYYNVKHITDIPHNPTEQAVVERSNCTLKEMLIKQNGRNEDPQGWLNSALLTLNFLNVNEKGTTAAKRHWVIEKKNVELN